MAPCLRLWYQMLNLISQPKLQHFYLSARSHGYSLTFLSLKQALVVISSCTGRLYFCLTDRHLISVSERRTPLFLYIRKVVKFARHFRTNLILFYFSFDDYPYHYQRLAFDIEYCILELELLSWLKLTDFGSHSIFLSEDFSILFTCIDNKINS